MLITGTQAEGGEQFVVLVDDLPSSRIEDAPDEIWAEARKFYGKQVHHLIGTFEGGGQKGYKFATTIE